MTPVSRHNAYPSLSGRRVAVTGATGGIGAAIVSLLVEQRAEVIAIDLRAADDRTGVTAYALDLTDPSAIDDMVEVLYRDDPRPIDLVTSAGIVEDDVAAEDLTVEQFARIHSVNLQGVFATNQAFGRELLARGGGAIVNIASMSGNAVVNWPQRQTAYNSSKAGVSALSRSLAVEWGGRGVRVNTVSPGYVDTPLNALKPHMHEGWLGGTVVGRFALPDEVAAAVAFLLSDDAGYFVGAELLMDGGYSLR